MVDGHSMTISVELFSVDQVDFDKKIFKLSLYLHRKNWSHPLLAEPHPMIIYAKAFSNPSVSISHDAPGLSAVCDYGISLRTHLLF